jgi:hypothetical protein
MILDHRHTSRIDSRSCNLKRKTAPRAMQPGYTPNFSGAGALHLPPRQLRRPSRQFRSRESRLPARLGTYTYVYVDDVKFCFGDNSTMSSTVGLLDGRRDGPRNCWSWVSCERKKVDRTARAMPRQSTERTYGSLPCPTLLCTTVWAEFNSLDPFVQSSHVPSVPSSPLQC